MYEARERILNRINPEVHKAIDLDKFLQGTVNELGKMMAVDRCDVMVLRKGSELKIDFEYCANESIPSSKGFDIPIDLEKLSSAIKLTVPIVINDTLAPGKDPMFRQIAQAMRTRSLLVVPIILADELLGFLGFHKCDFVHQWYPEEVQFIESMARHIAIGYKYAHIFNQKEKEAEINRALLEIANDINAQRDLAAITAHTVERSLAVLKADFGCLGILDSAEKYLHFDTVSSSVKVDPTTEIALLPGQDLLAIADYPVIRRTLYEKTPLLILHPDQDEAARFYLHRLLPGQSALIVPIVTNERTVGLLCLVWYAARHRFSDIEVRLAEGIASQIAIAMQREQLSAEILRLRRELNRQTSNILVGCSEKIRQISEMALKVADTSTTVLLEGETGTGKEVIATLIQQNSSRATRPFVKVNCGAIPESLMESELFGHERGAFTDARSRRVGRFEEAHRGTLFLDEVGEMSPAAQVTLLRVLQDGSFKRVGGSEELKVDVRIIAATNVDLKEAIKSGRFREDLYFRLNVYPIRLPALRERKEDIPLLAMHFLDMYNKRTGKVITSVSDAALRVLQAYCWPGNVRELENAVERAVIVTKGRTIKVEDLPESVMESSEVAERQTLDVEIGSSLESVERRLIEQTLAFTQGDKSQAAQILGIGRKTLYRKLEQYGQGK
jgi:two-component system response regulator HydG